MKEFFPVLRSSQLFSGVSEEELTAMLTCLGAEKRSFPKEAFLLRSGDTAGARASYNELAGVYRALCGALKGGV